MLAFQHNQPERRITMIEYVVLAVAPGIFWLWFFPFLWRLSAFSALILYLGLQVVLAWAQRGGLTNVSAFAHLGGLAVGLAAGLAVRWVRAARLAA